MKQVFVILMIALGVIGMGYAKPKDPNAKLAEMIAKDICVTPKK